MKLFIDMDGVLSDFDNYITITKGYKTKVNWGDRWNELPDRMFQELEKMPDADQLMNYAEMYSPSILTAIPKKDKVKFARVDKFKWMKKYYNIDTWNIHTVYREEKQLFAVGDHYSPNILIDDNEQNIEEWIACGGAGILHSSAANSILELQKLGF